MKRSTVAVALAAPLLFAAACSEDEAQYRVRFAPEFQKTSMPAVSVLGVFRDGRMNAETWDEIGKQLSSPFGAETCPVAYDKDFASKREDLAQAVDDYARENGVTDDLLEKLAPAASGDVVLVFTIAGKPIAQEWDAGPSPAARAPNSTPGGMRGGRGRGTMAIGPMRHPEGATFELAASLYSRRDHKSVGLVALEYSGHSAQDALAKFVAKLREQIPNASCAGWKWDTATVDAEAIRKLREEG